MECVQDESDATCLNELSFRKHKAVLPVTTHGYFLYLPAAPSAHRRKSIVNG